MDHLPFVAAAYGISLAVIAWLSLDAMLRVRRARRRLAAIDKREGRAR